MSPKVLRVGSRKSALALLQTNITIHFLKELNPQLEFDIVEISTIGDKILDKELSKIGDKSLFTKELENALLNGEVDFVVHSLKDMPTTLPTGLVLGCIFDRTETEDVVLMSTPYRGLTLADLPDGSIVGSGSLRRVASHQRSYPRLRFVPIRGNLNTRLAKLDNGSSDSSTYLPTRSAISEGVSNGEFSAHYDAIILAKAGIQRLGWSSRIDQVLSESLYAVSQGALTCECRQDDWETMDLLAGMNDDYSAVTTVAERSLMRQLNGGCATPIGVRTHLTPVANRRVDRLGLEAEVMSLDGSQSVRDYLSVDLPVTAETNDLEQGSEHSPQTIFLGLYCKPSLEMAVIRQRLSLARNLGATLALRLLSGGADRILEDIRAKAAVRNV